MTTTQRFPLASTRETFGKVLLELGKENPNIVVVGGDLNKSTFANLFGAAFPERFFDLGAAEQNMMSLAAGLACAGKVPVCNTFAVFATGRPFDQIRTSIAQPNLNVKIVATHAGLSVGEDGTSAQAIEDLALMTSLPTMTVIAPADAVETEQAVRAALNHAGPVYIRLYRPATPVVHSKGCEFKLGKAELLRDGGDATVIACGVMVAAALEAAETLAGEGIRCRVLNMHTLQPLDEQAIEQAARETGAVVTAEEHLIHGGLGSLVATVLARCAPTPMEFVALQRYAESGKGDELLQKYGLTAADVAEAVRKVLRRKRR
ncbi:MAG: transketolase family protein [Dehalococcoidia bacterium]|nr:transketolase family protein [Dehalococcoidia bacterium]